MYPARRELMRSFFLPHKTHKFNVRSFKFKVESTLNLKLQTFLNHKDHREDTMDTK
ncbi:hypothetical protein SAMN03080601_00898 [Alkalitalea saponilacus]|uniref:Uncharacterized protein n=1 Tax=Alkalitalea saponilacus TaxID=889453 RepID=A0A1T5CP19_9BACT|nr:hypothetical protein SAMN03080601_00898 [Alkalitalea saponilacus]